MDKEYTILKAEKRQPWFSKNLNKEFQTYALQLEGVDGWVELSQLPETPAPEGTIYGHTTAQTVGQNTYLKFKKVNPGYEGRSSGSQPANDKQDYIVEMLEELTGRKPKKDVVLEDIDDTPIDLADIPF